jgi:predicted nucleic acid-binding protein
VVGLDTGFFVKLLGADERARDLWRKLADPGRRAGCSCLTLFELDRLALRGQLDRRRTDTLLNALPAACRVVWITRTAVLTAAARVSHSASLPAVDALIFASLKGAGARTIYTTDDWSTVQERGVKIVNL